MTDTHDSAGELVEQNPEIAARRAMGDGPIEAVTARPSMWEALSGQWWVEFDPEDESFRLRLLGENPTEWCGDDELPNLIACLDAIARKRDELRGAP